jgi:uncharacterized membrane protein
MNTMLHVGDSVCAMISITGFWLLCQERHPVMRIVAGSCLALAILSLLALARRAG